MATYGEEVANARLRARFRRWRMGRYEFAVPAVIAFPGSVDEF